MWFWMAEPAAKPYLARLPTEQQELAGFMCLSFLVQSLQPFTAFAKALSDINPNGMHQLVVARGYVFQGNFDKAERLVKTRLPRPYPVYFVLAGFGATGHYRITQPLINTSQSPRETQAGIGSGLDVVTT